MSRTARELWANLAAGMRSWGGPVFPAVLGAEVTGTSTDTIPVFVATRDMAIRRAQLVQEQSPDGAKTLKLRNLTDSEDLTDAIDSDALSADTSSAFTIKDAADEIDEGDVIGLVYTVNTAGTTAPLEVAVTTEFELIESKD